jgi:hypothetical protein
MDYLQPIADQMGINVWLLLVIIIWSVLWKLAAMWKSARKGQPIWFVVLALLNTIGILEILYIYVFSEMKNKIQDKPNSKINSTKKKKSKKK